MLNYLKIDPIIEQACKELEKIGKENKKITYIDVENAAKKMRLTIDADIYDYYCETVYSNYNIN